MSLNNDVAQVGSFQLVLNEDIISKATKLPQTSECWFKGQRVNRKQCELSLLPLRECSYLKNCVSVNFLKPRWRAFFDILIMYVSCDD